MTEKEKMLAGELYLADDTQLVKERMNARRLTRLYNQTPETDVAYRAELVQELFGKTGVNFNIEPPFRCDYGYNISVGENFYANFDCIILDVCKVQIGNNVFFGPRVCIYAAGHPIDATVRNTLLEFGKPITIGNSVWVGGNTTINPGVTIGGNSIIGSGSVVTKDIPENVIAVGNPCRVFRKINAEDQKKWEEKERAYKNDSYLP